MNKNNKLLNFVTYISSNAHICGSFESFFSKFRSFVIGYRYSKFISVIIKNLYISKLYLNMNIYSLFKYGIFCFICVNSVLGLYTKTLAQKIGETYMVGWWINGFLTNYKSVQFSGLLKKGKNFNTPRLPSVVFFDSLKYARVMFVLEECQKMCIPSLVFLETDLNNFKSSYFSVSNSQSMATYLLYVYSISSNILKIKHKRFYSLFNDCLSVDFLYNNRSVFRLKNLKLSMQFYLPFESKKMRLVEKLGKKKFGDLCFTNLANKVKYRAKFKYFLRNHTFIKYLLCLKKKACANIWLLYNNRKRKYKRRKQLKKAMFRRARERKKQAELKLRKDVRGFMLARYKLKKWKKS
jgi:hypothetical protein